MPSEEQRARDLCRRYACQIATFAHYQRLLDLPATSAEWQRRLNRYVNAHWREFQFLDAEELDRA